MTKLKKNQSKKKKTTQVNSGKSSELATQDMKTR